MKIGMILDNTFPPDPRVENEATSLLEQGHQMFLYCLDYTYDQPEYEKIRGIYVYRKKLSKLFFSLSALAYTIPAYHFYLKKSISRFIINHKIEAIHVHDIQIARSVFSINKKFNLPIILDLHENRPEIMKYYAHVNSILGKLLIHASHWKKYEYKYIKAAQKVIVITEEAKEYYVNEVQVDEDKIFVVPNSVRKDFYTNYKLKQDVLDQYTNHFTILYIGETGLRRGLVTIIKSLQYLIPQIPNIKLVIVGQAKTDYVLKNLVNKLGYENYVELTGWKEFKLLPSYIFSSDLGICPIHKNLHHETTYANKIFQYLAFGKPIIVSDCKAQKNIVEKHNCGLVFKDQNVKNFADKVLILYRDKSLYQKLSINAKKAINEKLHWGKISKNLIKLYNKIEKNRKSEYLYY